MPEKKEREKEKGKNKKEEKRKKGKNEALRLKPSCVDMGNGCNEALYIQHTRHLPWGQLGVSISRVVG